MPSVINFDMGMFLEMQTCTQTDRSGRNKDSTSWYIQLYHSIKNETKKAKQNRTKQNESKWTNKTKEKETSKKHATKQNPLNFTLLCFGSSECAAMDELLQEKPLGWRNWFVFLWHSLPNHPTSETTQPLDGMQVKHGKLTARAWVGAVDGGQIVILLLLAAAYCHGV